MHLHKSTKYYQSIPFDSYRGLPSVRDDCEKRYRAIYSTLDGLKDTTIVDFGCAEGYFGWRFLQDGARHVTFVDNDRECLRLIGALADENGFSTRVSVSETYPKAHCFDVGLVLDVWSEHIQSPTLEELGFTCRTLFISMAGDGLTRNLPLRRSLESLFEQVEGIHKGYQNRMIYRCH